MTSVTQAEALNHKIINFFSALHKKKILFIFPDDLAENSILENLNKEAIVNALQLIPFRHKIINPTITNVEQAVHTYFSQKCEAILVLGGGALLDLAKAVKARIIHPDKNLYKLFGYATLKHRSPEPLLVVCPTTISAAETNYAAYILDYTNQKKFLIADQALLPNFILYCPELILQMPDQVLIGSYFSAFSMALEVFLQKNPNPKAIDAAEQGLQLLEQEKNILLDISNKSFATQDTERLYTGIVNLQKANRLIGQASRKENGGYFTSFHHALQLFYQYSDDQISGPTLHAVSTKYLELIKNENTANSALIKYQKYFAESAALTGMVLKVSKISSKLSALKQNDFKKIIDYVEKDVQEKANLSFFFEREALEQILLSMTQRTLH